MAATDPRTTPEPPTAALPSNALAELSLAHRRLSAKLDFTEQQLASASLELAHTRQELQRTVKERDHERAQVAELRRVEDDREEEIAWERSERRRFEEQKNLCDLALAEYAALVKKLDPAAVPPTTPRRKSNNILQVQPELSSKSKEGGEKEGKGEGEGEEGKDEPAAGKAEDATAEENSKDKADDKTNNDAEDEDDLDDLLSFGGSDTKAPSKLPSKLPADTLASSDAISNLIVGQRGVQRLFRDFSSTLTAKEAEIRQLQLRAEELENLLATTKEQLKSETDQRVEAASERDRALRDDASAAKVVERYMTFSQKAHETVHGHLGQLRARGAATQASLRAEAQALRRRLHAEAERAKQIRAAAEDMADEVGRESAGRRREVALRLQLIAAEEGRAKRIESWLDRVRRARQQPDTVDSETVGALLDDGVDILSPAPAEVKAAGWGRRLLRKKTVSPSEASTEDESVARIFLAEELVRHLTDDLQIETERRIDLEKQRVAWLAKEAEEGVPAGQALVSGQSLFDADTDGGTPKEKKDGEDKAAEKAAKVDKEGEADKETAGDVEPKDQTDDRAASPIPETPEMAQLSTLFKTLEERYSPIQKLLHDQAVSLAALRASLPASGATSGTSTPAVAAPKRGGIRALVRGRSAQDDLLALLDGLHEVIEDARVDAEIAVADEDRVFHGFAALLGVGASGVVQAASVLRDAVGYTEARVGADTPIERLDSRVGEIEHDLAIIKRTLHEAEGMDAPAEDTPAGKGRRQSVWTTLALKTVTPTLRPTVPLLLPVSESDDDEEPRRVRGAGSLLSSVGRSFSSGVVGAPRRVSGLAGGLYRPRKEDDKEKEPLVERKSEDDVE